MIREVRREEIPECVRVIRTSHQTVADAFGFTVENAPRYVAFATDENRLRWHMDGEHRLMYLEEEGGAIRGYYSLFLKNGGECELGNLSVLPEYRHRGIGTALLRHAERTAREHGCRVMRLSIVEENRVLRDWYERNGAVHTGTEKFSFFPFTCGYMMIDLETRGEGRNTVWSEHVQGVMTLYLSRKLRFDDLFFAQYDGLFGLDRDRELKILEIGCGPGALAESLHRWYPKAQVTAIDRDSAFIAFARERVAGVRFIEGDATRLPFENDTFDVTISNTVSEHIEPSAFWGEQRRVLKPGGVCLCLSARKGLHCTAPCLETTDEEKAFWDSIPESESSLEKYGVCRYPMTEAGLPASMERHGFREVTTGYAVIDLTPDAAKYPDRMAEDMIEAGRQSCHEAIQSAHSDHAEKAVAAVNRKYDERIRLYRAGIRQWDTSVSVTMVVRGIK